MGAVTLGATGCSGSSLSGGEAAGSGETIKIGFVADLSGAQKEIGENQRQGFELYLKLHDHKLGGHKVDFVVADESQNTDKAQASVQKLLKKDRVLALTGLTQSATVNLAEPLATSLHTPIVGSLGRPANLKDDSYVWHTSFMSTAYGRSMATYVSKKLKGKSVYAIGPDQQGGHDHVGGFVRTYTGAGGKLANLDGKPTYTPWPPTDNNFQPQLAKIQQSGADGVFAFFFGSSAIQFVKQYKQFGLAGKVPLFASGALTEGSLLQAEGDAALGIKNSNPYAVDLDNAENRKFVSEYQKQYHKLPTTYVMTSYDAAYVLDRAIAAAGSNVTGESVNAEIGKLGQIESPRGPWQFDDGHTPLQKWYLRDVEKDGKALSNVLVQELGMFGTDAKS